MRFGSKSPVITTSILLALAVVLGVVGWSVIEFILWVFSFIHVSFGG